MFLSVTHRILGPIALLIVIGAATTALISYEAVRAHDDLQSQEERAYEFLFSVERTQAALQAIEDFSNDILSFNLVVPAPVIATRYQSLRDTLMGEIRSIEALADEASVASSVARFSAAAGAWQQEVEIALGLTAEQAIPSHIRLEQLSQAADDAVAEIYGVAKTGAITRSGMKSANYKSRVNTIFHTLLVIFTVFGFFFLMFGRRLTRSLGNVARSMDRIRQGNFEPGIEREFSKDEIGDIARGVQVFGETLKALTQANEKVKHLAMHDQLTGLANRRALEDHLEAVIAGRAGQAGKVAIFHIDLDRFKQVNDMYGHAAGDEILRHASEAMKANQRSGDLVARIGGDEFVIVLEDIESEAVAAGIAERMIASISAPIEIWNDVVNVGASIGIAFLDDADTDIERILANADMALYIAKGAGRGRHSFYSTETRKQFETDMSLLRELRSGLEKGEIVAYFQPQIDAASNKLIGFEALARWVHPTRGTLGPGHFLSLAFDNGLGDRLSDIIVREAISALRDWRGKGLDVPRVSVNFAAKQLRDSGVTEYLDDALFQACLSPEDIAIEVLESVLFGDDADPAHATISQLKRRGYRIELDDFGTGHASISNLRKFRVDGVKLDRVFVTGVDSDPEQEMILRTLIDLCRNLGIGCLAEGVETEAERSKLLALGCSRIQGYGIAMPMARDEVVDWVRSRDAPQARPKAV